MTERVVFHIGDHKTGTTSIQQVLAAGAWEGPEIAYPVAETRLNHKPAADTLFRPGRGHRVADAFAKLNRRANHATAPVTVFSAESFENVPAQALKAAIETHMPAHAEKIQVIAYVRPHAERVLSSYMQALKVGNFDGTIERFFAKKAEIKRYIYTPRFTAWRKAFGDRFTLRPMVRGELFRGDVVADFLKYAVGTEDFQVNPDFVTGNESLALADMVMIRAFHRNKNFGDRMVDNRGKATWAMARLLAADPPAVMEKLAIHESLMAQIEAEYRADAEALDAAFFEGTPMADALDRAHTKTVPEAQSLQLSDYYDPETLRLLDVFGELTDTLLARDPKDWSGYLRKIWIEELRDAD